MQRLHHPSPPARGCLQARQAAAAAACAPLAPPLGLQRRRVVVARASPDDAEPPGSKKELESLFVKELKRRGLDSIDDVPGWQPKDDEGAAVSTSTSKSPFATKTSPRTAQSAADGGGGDQRQRSIALVNEGLEGLIPRATELLKLGGSVFLAFAPFIVAISLAFWGIFAVFGDQFVHGGSAGPPPYVDPQELLSEPTVDPYIPFR